MEKKGLNRLWKYPIILIILGIFFFYLGFDAISGMTSSFNPITIFVLIGPILIIGGFMILIYLILKKRKQY